MSWFRLLIRIELGVTLGLGLRRRLVLRLWLGLGSRPGLVMGLKM